MVSANSGLDFEPCFTNSKFILFRFKHLEQNYLASCPFEKWNFVRGIHMSAARIIVCDFVEDDYKLTLRSWLPTPLADYIILLMNTLYFFRNDPVRGLMATPAIGIVFPVRCIIAFCFAKLSKYDIDLIYLFCRALYSIFLYWHHPVAKR